MTRCRLHPTPHALAGALLLATLVSVPARAQGDRDPDAVDKAALRRLAAVQRDYCDDLCKLAAAALKKGLVAEATDLRKRVTALDPENPLLAKLAERFDSATPETDEKALESARSSLTRRLEDADERHGKKLYGFAVACMKFGLFTKAYDMLLKAVELNPDDKKARSALGYRYDSREKEWISAWEYDMRRKNFLTEEGWFEKKYKRDYDKGLRPYQNQWIPKEREAEVRGRSNAAPYTVQSEHFTVKTNLGREKAWDIAMRLEDFYREFFRTFIGYYDQVAGAKLLFNSPDAKLTHEVVIFPDRDEYLIHVKEEAGNDPLLIRSGGFYSSGDRLSRFYWNESNPDDTISTLYHEVGHQLFAETKAGSRGSSDGNNWVVEGIAVYIETWKKTDGRWIPGGNRSNDRLVAARQILASAGEKWSLAGFAAIGHKEFHGEGQADQSQRGANYALAGALCHFFMHHDDEVYREDFVKFLSDYYAGKVRKDSLGGAIRDADGNTVGFAALDKQFREYMANLR